MQSLQRLLLISFLCGTILSSAKSGAQSAQEMTTKDAMAAIDELHRAGIAELRRRELDLQARLAKVSRDAAELERRIDTTQARIDCAAAMMQIAAAVCVGVLLGIATEMLIKKYKQVHKPKKPKKRLKRNPDLKPKVSKHHSLVKTLHSIGLKSEWPAVTNLPPRSTS